ncbi:hypothetical protein SeLEV6574_g04488 [Synchytrium endobioticum]|uniref:HAUS augmin-like complex subunit 6 N-terminal domain-containing protein n=1 Tax=Synchytrium endobioticum TaxID=286115 RepID=A0A507CZI5_9FUNG|nr:hypothetical protein SeLEV6574_g04488 [Synchytrium endobioticum]
MNVFCLAAFMAFFTSGEAAPADESSILEMIHKLWQRSYEVTDRRESLPPTFFEDLAQHPNPTFMLSGTCDMLCSTIIPQNSPYTKDQLLQPFDVGSMETLQIWFYRAYNACVFQRLNYLHLMLQSYITRNNLGGTDALTKGLTYVRNVLRKHDLLAGQLSASKNQCDMILDRIARERGLVAGMKTSDSRRKAHFHGMCWDTPSASIQWHLATMTRHTILSNANRFESLESPRPRLQRFTYERLNELPVTKLCWLKVRVAHERLIIDRAQHDMMRLHSYLDDKPGSKAVVSKRLSEYSNFIDEHQGKITNYEDILQGYKVRGILDCSYMNHAVAGTSGVISKDTVAGPSTSTSQRATRSERQMEACLCNPNSSTLGSSSAGEACSNEPVPMGGQAELSDYRPDRLHTYIGDEFSPIVVVTENVHDPAQHHRCELRLLDLLGTDIGREDPQPELIDLRITEENASTALDLTLGPPNLYRFQETETHVEQSPVAPPSQSIYWHHPESSAQSYNDRADGKRPMNAHASVDPHFRRHDSPSDGFAHSTTEKIKDKGL